MPLTYSDKDANRLTDFKPQFPEIWDMAAKGLNCASYTPGELLIYQGYRNIIELQKRVANEWDVSYWIAGLLCTVELWEMFHDTPKRKVMANQSYTTITIVKTDTTNCKVFRTFGHKSKSKMVEYITT